MSKPSTQPKTEGNNEPPKAKHDSAQRGQQEVPMVLSETQVLPSAKETKERLLMIHDEYKSRLDKLMTTIEQADPYIEDDETIIAKEEFAQLKVLLGRIQLGVYDSHLLITLVEYLQILESCRSKLRIETRRLAHENANLRHSIQVLQEDIFEKEAELAAVHEERDHWVFMCNMSKIDPAVAVEKEEQEIWDSTIYPEIVGESSHDLQEMAPELKPVYESMTQNLLDGKVKEAVDAIQKYIDNQGKGTGQEAVLLTLAAKHCTEKNMLVQSLELLNKALQFRQTTYGESHDLVTATRNNIALIYWRKGDMKEAAECAYSALRAMEKKFGKEDNPELAKQYLRTGFLLTKWGYVEDGIKLMELSVLTLENMLPNEEANWLISLAKLTRACNDAGAYEDALCLCCEAIDYFHESKFGEITESNKPIYEIAAEHQECESSNETPPDLPKAVPLDMPIVSILRELAIVFASYFLFTAAKVIDKWLEECLENVNIQGMVNQTSDRVYALLGKKNKLKMLNKEEGQEGAARPRVRHGKKGGTLAATFEKSVSMMANQPGRQRILEIGTGGGPNSKLRRGLFNNVNTRLNNIFKKPKP